jgi:hypothetical protein
MISSIMRGEAALVEPAQHALEDRHGVPGAEEDPDAAPGRQRAPEAPHRRAHRLLLGRQAEARTSMKRGSIHSLSRWTVSPLPAPSTPAIRIRTAKGAFSRSVRCATSNELRSVATSRSYSAFGTSCLSAADSNMGATSP